MAKLALKGGTPVRASDNLFPEYNTMGDEERRAVTRVLDSGILSGYFGAWSSQFYGGPEVQAFESEWAKKFGVKHAVAMNSASSGLVVALGALGIEPGDEVIVTPLSMCISATAPLWYGAVPVFADIEPEYFCIDPQSVEKVITSRTKAIIAVDICGQSHDVDAINAIAKKHGLKVIADTAQSPGARYKGAYAGTLSDIGVYSLNYHKHIHTGEGTLVVTNDDKLAERLQLIRNHAEAVVEDKGVTDTVNMVGQNLRMLELQAAIGRAQLQKLDSLIVARQKNCSYLEERLRDMPGIRVAPTRPDATHVYYVYPFLFDEDVVGVPRDIFVQAIAAELPETKLRRREGALINAHFGKPLYQFPIFRQPIAFGSHGYPFKSPFYKGKANYERGICPVSERLYESSLFVTEMMRPGMSKKDLDDVVEAFHKVYRHRDELR